MEQFERSRQPLHPSKDHVVITLGSMTHKGMKRSSNEDFYCALDGPSPLLGADALLAVADGMGGIRREKLPAL